MTAARIVHTARRWSELSGDVGRRPVVVPPGDFDAVPRARQGGGVSRHAEGEHAGRDEGRGPAVAGSAS
jgi:hypothetical protein